MMLCVVGANAQSWWKATSSTVIDANTAYVDNDILTVKTVFNGKVSGYSHTYEKAGNVEFTSSIQVRTDKAPTTTNLTGTERTDCTPLIITANEDATITFFYRRQSKSSDYISNDGKDVLLVNQTAPTTKIESISFTKDDVADDYGYVFKTYELEKGNTYTLYAIGTTIGLNGFSYSAILPEATEKTIYFRPNDEWSRDDARFAIYAFNSETDNEWYSLEKGESVYYSATIPATWNQIILVRMNPATEENSWDNKWTQTDNINFNNDNGVVADNTLFFMLPTSDNWTAYGTRPYDINKVSVVGDFGGSWTEADGWAMTQSATDPAVWTLTKEGVEIAAQTYEYKVVGNESYDVYQIPASGNASRTFTERGVYTLTFTVNLDVDGGSVNLDATKTAANWPIHSMTIAGNFPGLVDKDNNWIFSDDWAMTQEEATLGAESTIWTLTKENVELQKGTYSYKAVVNKDWADQQWPASGNNTVEIEETGVYNLEFLLNTAIGSDNLTLNANKVGDYEPAWTYSVAGNGFLGNWDKTYDMTDADADGIYTWTTAQENLSGSVEFKVIKKDAKGIVDNVWCPSGDNITITFDETYNYTITFSINSATDEVSYTCEKREYPEYAANNVYFWESPDGIVNQNGGTAVHNNNERVNYANSGYYTICLNGKNDFSSDIITIALDHALKAGDQISITAYRTKDNNSGAKLKFGDNTTYTTVGDKTGFVNISNGDKPNTLTVEAPALAEGCKTITLTRSSTSTNLFITKIVITRPNITHTATFTTNKGWEEVAAYVWSGEDSNKVLGEWPGTVLEADAEGVYTVTIEALEAPEHIIFNNNGNGQQTADLVFENGKAYSYNSLTLASTADNTAAIDENDGNTADVTLEGVTLYKDGLWFTLCLPFDVADFGGTPLADATVHAMDAANSNLTDGTLTLNFITGIGSIEAGKPYIVKWNDGTDIENPEFKNVTIKKDAPVAVEGSKVSFVGTYAQMASVTDANKLFLGVDGTQSALYTPAAADLGAFRAYFNVEGDATQVRQFALNFDGETTGIGASLMNSERVNSEVYNLNGQRVAQPSKGLYIVNGRKVVIK